MTARRRRKVVDLTARRKAREAPPARSRFAEYRDRVRGGPPRELAPCGSVAAARRHQRAGEALCEACAVAWRGHQHAMYLRRKGEA